MSPIGAHMLIMYSRARSLFHGSTVLLDAQLPQEAIMLCRELFTVSLQLTELASRESDRPSLILSMLNRSLTEWEVMEEQAVRIGVSDQQHAERLRDYVARERTKIQNYCKRHGINKLKRMPSEKALAEKHKRLEEYIDFELANNVVHRTDIAQMGRVGNIGGVTTVAMQDGSKDFKESVAAFALTSALHACDSAVRIFGWLEPTPEELARLLEELESAVASLVASNNP